MRNKLLQHSLIITHYKPDILHEKPDILNLDIEIFNISFKNSSVSHNKEKHAFLSFLVHMIPNHYLEKKKFGDYKYNLSAGIDCLYYIFTNRITYYKDFLVKAQDKSH